MCGIVGYVGQRPCRDLLVAGLEKLEYRGYDSAGISLLEDGHDRHRPRGRQPLQPTRGRRPDADDGATAAPSPSPRRPRRSASVTRAGRPTAESPRRTPTLTATAPTASTSSSTGSSRTTPSCASELDGRGPRFSSETDAEIVAHLIEKHYDGDLTAAVRAAFSRPPRPLRVRRHARRAPRCARRRAAGVPADRRPRRQESFIASAIPAFLAETRTCSDQERRDRDRRPRRRHDHGRRRARRSSARSRRSPGTRRRQRRAATRPS